MLTVVNRLGQTSTHMLEKARLVGLLAMELLVILSHSQKLVAVRLG